MLGDMDMSVQGDQQGEVESKLVFLQLMFALLRSINAFTMSNLSDGSEDEVDEALESDDKSICVLSGEIVGLMMGDTNGELSMLEWPITKPLTVGKVFCKSDLSSHLFSS